MNCECFKNVEEKLLNRGIWEGRKIESAKMENLMITFGTNGGQSGTLSYEEFDAELEGLKRPKKIKVAHMYCPYCGVKVGKLDENEPDNNPLEL